MSDQITSPQHPCELLQDAVNNGIQAIEVTATNQQHKDICQNIGQLAAVTGSIEVQQVAIKATGYGKPKALALAKVAAMTRQEDDALIAAQEFTMFAAHHTALNDRNENCLFNDAVQVYTQFPDSEVLRSTALAYDSGNAITHANMQLTAPNSIATNDHIHTLHDAMQERTAAYFVRRYEESGHPNFLDAALLSVKYDVQYGIVNKSNVAEYTEKLQALYAHLCSIGCGTEAEQFMAYATATVQERLKQEDGLLPTSSLLGLQNLAVCLSAVTPTQQAQEVMPVSQALRIQNKQAKTSELYRTYSTLARAEQQKHLGSAVVPLSPQTNALFANLLALKPQRPTKRGLLQRLFI